MSQQGWKAHAKVRALSPEERPAELQASGAAADQGALDPGNVPRARAPTLVQ